MNAADVASLIKLIMSAYPGSYFGVTEDTVSVWAEMLSDMDSAAVDAAVRDLIMESRTPPTISEIREAVKPRNERNLPWE